jgi:tetratricopeptide (TPR) repeat protein
VIATRRCLDATLRAVVCIALTSACDRLSSSTDDDDSVARRVAESIILPDDDAARLAELDRRVDQGAYASVIEELPRYIAEHPKSYRAWSLLGFAYARSDQPDAALAAFDESLELNPEWDNAHVGKGVVHRMRGELDEALAAYRRAIEISPRNGEAYTSIAVIEIQRGDDDAAVAAAEKAWSFDRRSPEVAANLAVAYHYAGDTAKRQEMYEHAARLGYAKMKSLDDIFAGRVKLR